MAADRTRQNTFEWRQVRVVALVVVATMILAYGVYHVGKVFDVFASRYEITMLVPSALGLREGAPVTLAGQRVGQVKGIRHIPVERKTGGHHLNLVLAISHDVREQIRTDSRGFLRTQGLLGDKFVDIQPGTSGARILQPGDTLDDGRSVDMDQFLAIAAEGLEEANAIAADLQTITQGLLRGEGTAGQLLRSDQLFVSLDETSAALRRTLADLNRADGTFSRLLHDPALYDRMHGAAARVDSLGALILDGNGSLGMLLRSDSVYRSALGTLSTADSAMTGVAALVRRMTQGDGALQKLMTDPALYDEFLKAIVDVQSLINDIRTDPLKYRPNVNIKIF